jgi:type II secretory pathway pseudopilin PulG
MTRLKIAVVGCVIIIGLVASMLIRSRSRDQLEQRKQLEEQQAQQVAQLSQEQQRLARLVAEKTNAQDESGNLKGLQSEAAALRKQTNELAARLQERSKVSTSRGWQPSPEPPEYYEALHKMFAGQEKDGMNLGMAFHMYASDHAGQVPTSLDQVTRYLQQEHLTLTGTNQFEIVFQGAPEKLQVPFGSIAVLRDTPARVGPDGQPTRIYLMADGSVQTIRAQDNFQAWEAEHVFPAR